MWAEGGPVSEAALSDRRPLPPCAAPVLRLRSPLPYFSQSSKL
jgi:hypothetical protein